jgi:hypothetical protein
MAYNIHNVSTAGKITVLSCIIGLLVFAFIFTLNIGSGSLHKVDAQSIATTTVTVLNTPPQWSVDAQEYGGSSSSTPTNAGDVLRWTAIGTDSNNEPYYLLICATNASPTALSSAPPRCDTSVNQWAVSTSTASGAEATAATTTLATWAEVNNWYAWLCDDNVTNPRCNPTAKQGTGTTSSPFEINHRPTFTVFVDNSPTLPGQIVTFMSTSSDTDVSGFADTVKLIVCSTNSFSTTTDTCTATTVASSTVFSAANASSTYTIAIPTQDQNYAAFGFVIDNHGFEATGGAQGTDAVLTVQNAAPTVASSTIVLNNGTDMLLTQAATQTPNYALQFTVSDNNSCVNFASTSEITSYRATVYRSGVGSTTCSGVTAGSYNANNCYTSAVASSTWGLTCTASSTSCSGPTDTTVGYNCSFPLWYIADPTDGTATSTQYPTQNWLSSILAVDDNAATSSLSESSTGVEVLSFLSFALNTLSIPYGALAPGEQTDPISATTTLSATGNVGLDERLTGSSMCTSYSTGSPCPNSATSTIAESNQVYATSTRTYAASTALSSTTANELEVNIPKSTATSSQATRDTIWGIAVPISITLAGNYKGENTFIGVVGESAFW